MLSLAMLNYRFASALFILVLCSLAACTTPVPPTPPPTPTLASDRLAAPPMPEQPTQADLGLMVYYQVCEACHGDRGQGLTDEWRAEWEEDAYCWNAQCHGSRHPPQGFSFPRTCCRALIGPGTLTRFKNAAELHTYLAETMPWWNPGYLKPEEYWQLTAFLLRAHGALPPEVILDAANATIFRLRLSAPFPVDPRPEVLIVAVVLACALGLLLFQNRLK